MFVTKHLIATYPDDQAWKQARLHRGANMSSLFGLAPGGVYRATSIAGRAVGSYPTLSPLPSKLGGLLSVALSLGSPPPGVTRHRVSMEPGLSSPHHLSTLCRAAVRPAGNLT